MRNKPVYKSEVSTPHGRFILIVAGASEADAKEDMRYAIESEFPGCRPGTYRIKGLVKTNRNALKGAWLAKRGFSYNGGDVREEFAWIKRA